MKKFFKVILIVIAVLVLLPILFLIVLHFISPDLAEIDDHDLIISIELPAESQNAYFDLVKAGEKVSTQYAIYEIVDYLKDGKTEVHYFSEGFEGEIVENFGDDNIEELLNENDEAISFFTAASEKDVYQNPILEKTNELNWDIYSVESNPQISQLGRLIAMQALYEFKKGNDADAFNMSLALAKVGQIIMDSNDVIITKLIAIYIKDLAFETMNYLIIEGDFNEVQLKSFKEKIEKYKNSAEGIYLSYKVEYIMQKNTVDLIVKEGQESFINDIFANHNFYFKSNKTKQMLADHTRVLLNNEPIDESLFVLRGGIVNFLTTENIFGKMIFASFAQTGITEKIEEIDLEYEKLLNLIELKLKDAEEKEFPKVPVKRT